MMKTDLGRIGRAARTALLCGAICAALAGCATSSMSGADWGKCFGAVVLGAGAGALVEGERGAYVGAAAGIAACFVINAHSKRTRTAAEVESDYRARHAQLPAAPEVVRYDTALSAPNVRRGEPLRIVSTIEAVQGRNAPIQEVKEQIRIYEPGSSQPFKNGEKIASAGGGGGYENTFTITFPSGMPQGRYAIETDLYVNGERTDRGTQQIQVVFNGQQVVELYATMASR